MTEKYIIGKLRDIPGATVIRHIPSVYSRVGIPDIAVIIDTQTYWIEIKIGTTKVTRSQMDLLHRIGGYVLRVTKTGSWTLSDMYVDRIGKTVKMSRLESLSRLHNHIGEVLGHE